MGIRGSLELLECTLFARETPWSRLAPWGWWDWWGSVGKTSAFKFVAPDFTGPECTLDNFNPNSAACGPALVLA